MDNISLQSTERTPEIQFDFQNNTYLIKGESYPEDVNEFFGPLVEQLETHLGDEAQDNITFTIELFYFNSSSAKILMGFCDMLEEIAEAGRNVHVIWRYEEGDDNMEELGEEYGEDMEHAKFTLEEYAPE